MSSGPSALGVLDVGVVIGGRYRVESALGKGAAAAVYRVIDARSGDALALKRLAAPSGRHHQLFVSQFEREYHSLCQLAHPAIIEVYDFGMDGDDAFYTMELLDGQDLRERSPLPWHDACSLLRDVASSLSVMHSRRLLHRDISARNVRCTSHGRAKLIDFGAMAPMGVAKHLVGTPPFVPPEALVSQPLDARADLYSLGALAYYMLTGRYAYPARNFGELRQLLGRPPLSCRAITKEIPEALDALVMQLMHVDPEARPATAAEVMERLSGIAGLPLYEQAEVSQSYLATPALGGRDADLDAMRTLLSQSHTGHGASLLFEGPAGIGRSRMVDACVLEAKLRGAIVLRGDTARGEQEYGLAKLLCEQLLQALPDKAREQIEREDPALAQLLGLHRGEALVEVPERQKLQRALRRLIRSLARSEHIVIAVDDVDRVDEPSAAWLAALALSTARRKLALVFTCESEVAEAPTLELIRGVATIRTLAALTERQTEALLRSVFGDADRLSALVERVHPLSGGNPRWVMALIEQLVQRGTARYEAGSWMLPELLTSADLPESLSAALAHRAAELPEDARALAATLALTDPAAFSIEELCALPDHGDRRRSYGAIDALLAGNVLVPSGDRHRFAQRELAEILREGLDPAQRRHLHARLAAALAHGDQPVLLAHHRLLGGNEQQAIDGLLALTSSTKVRSNSFLLELLERALPAAERLALPIPKQVALRAWLVSVAALLGERDCFMRYAEPLVTRLMLDSGLDDYQALKELPEQERLHQALTRTQQRYDATPEAERGLAPIDAIRQLARACAIFVSMASLAQDMPLIERVPSMAPLAVLAPVLWFVDSLAAGMRDYLAGRYAQGGHRYREMLDRLSQPDRGGLEPAHHKLVRQALLTLCGIFAAAAGEPDAASWVVELSDEPGHRVAAFRIRMAAALMQGDVETAKACSERADLLAMRDGGQVPYPGSTDRIGLFAYMHLNDVIGVKRAMERIELVARRHPGWQPTLGLARGHYLRLQGDPQAALEITLHALRQVEPGRHPDWCFLAALQVRLLYELGRHAEAVATGTQYLASCEALGIDPGHRLIAPGHVMALIALGRVPEACALADRCIAEEAASGARGPTLGIHYEMRVRVAIAMGDAQQAREQLAHCADQYLRGKNQALHARYQSLAHELRESGLEPNGAGQAAGGLDAMTMTSRAGPDRSRVTDMSGHSITGPSELEASRAQAQPDDDDTATRVE